MFIGYNVYNTLTVFKTRKEVRFMWNQKKESTDSIGIIKYKPIGIIHSSFKEPHGTPIQPAGAKGATGTVEVFPDYQEGLQDLDGFSHIILIYHLHQAGKARLKSKPFMDDAEHGIFAIRGPNRPNPIGISVVNLDRVETHGSASILHIRNLDILEGTPLLDIKPYVPDFDSPETSRIGWLEKNIHKLADTKADRRFTK